MPGKFPPPRRAEVRGTFKDGKWNESAGPRGEHLTPEEVESLYESAGKIGRNRPRDQAMIWIGFVHGLRAIELVTLSLEQYEMKANKLNVIRVEER